MAGKKSVVSVVSSILEESSLETVKRSDGSLTVGEIIDLMRAGAWVTDAAYQRSEVSNWYNATHCNAVFDSMFRGVGFGALTVNTIGDKYSVIDGGHRSRFLSRAVAGDITWRGRSLSDNPDLLSAFRALVVSVVEYNALDDSACASIFEALNDGVSMSAMVKRRGRVRDVITGAGFASAVDHLKAILPDVAGRSPKRESVEEILLQAVAGALGVRDYTGESVISKIAGASPEEKNKAVARVVQNVAALAAWCKDDKSGVKRALKRSWLNVFLSLDRLDVGHLSGFCAQFASDIETKTEQTKQFTEAASSSSASVASVTARFAIAEIVNAGKYDRGTVKVKPAKSSKSESGVVSEVIVPDAASLMSPVYKGFEVEAVAAWGREKYDWVKVSDALDMYGGPTCDPKPYTDDKGVHCVSMAGRKPGQNARVLVLEKMLKAVEE